MAEEFIWDVNIPFKENVVWNTLLTKYEDGKEQRRRKWSQPKRDYEVTLKARTDIVSKQVWDFYNAREGAFGTFYFENPNESPISGELVGVGNGVVVSFQLDHFPLPSGSVTLATPTVNYVENTHYVLTRSTGEIVFYNDAPPTGDLTASYDFCRIVRFAEDKLNRELFNYKLYNLGLKMVEVL